MKRILCTSLAILLALYVVFWLNANSGDLIKSQPELSTVYIGNCTWYDPEHDILLDLSRLKSQNINGYLLHPNGELPPLYFSYTPCAQEAKCYNSTDTAYTMIAVSNDSFCTNLTNWYPQSPVGNFTDSFWVFEFYNIATHEFGNSTTEIVWFCDYDLNPGEWYANISNYYKIGGLYFFQFFIVARDACPEKENITTTTTQSPIGDCLWNIGNNTLNLTRFRETRLARIDDTNSSLVIAMSPCSNYLRCDNMQVMVFRENWVSAQCFDYLAVWEDGLIEPSYNMELKSWQFVYTNGEKCGGYDRILSVFWECDVTTNNNPQIVSFQEIGTCAYEMHINTTYACD